MGFCASFGQGALCSDDPTLGVCSMGLSVRQKYGKFAQLSTILPERGRQKNPLTNARATRHPQTHSSLLETN